MPLGPLNREPPLISYYTNRIYTCEYCNKCNICKIYTEENNIGRVIVCNECENKQLYCEGCNNVIEGYPGQRLSEIRYELDPFNEEVYHPFDKPIYCLYCIEIVSQGYVILNYEPDEYQIDKENYIDDIEIVYESITISEETNNKE